MSKTTNYAVAKKIMGKNFLGVDELEAIEVMKLSFPDDIPEIPYSEKVLKEKKDDYLLVLGVSMLADGKTITIRNLKGLFGKDPDAMEPCFYNQDWYDKEDFIDIPMKSGWFFIRKKVYENSRAMQPQELTQKYSFPLAITCVYAFFIAWLALKEKLWYHDFIWCSDTDHNGDRIYVGKYHDVDGVNKNGFSIHRHLALKSCYGCID